MLSNALSANNPQASQLQLFRLSSERRVPLRVKIEIGGRFMLEDRSEHGGTAINASIKALGIRSDAVVRIGERVVGYFDTIGRIEGSVERLAEDGFVVELATTLRKRDKLAAQLIWLANREQLGLPEDRRHDRIVPRDPRIMVRNLSNGLAPTITGHVIDISLSGARVSVPGEFQKGDDLLLGTTPARVVRAFDGGVAVEFRAPVPEKMFSPGIRL
ncbi:MAG: PilZ domain-containing protein [Methylobacterium sp.]|nr:PilZ domain-containing protein [Methylobacterium sp.]MCA3608640.1 PilZ domain-containing protein [Methylobacterium sp.]MCA3618715.1 PilZ domain-containing protein [Methylobacterium sp.]MCA3621278.1 PilZ domain-containing protein [Methylobacterium sp.]